MFTIFTIYQYITSDNSFYFKVQNFQIQWRERGYFKVQNSRFNGERGGECKVWNFFTRIIQVGIFRVGVFGVGIFLGGNFPGGNFPGGNYPRWELSGWEFSRWELSSLTVSGCYNANVRLFTYYKLFSNELKILNYDGLCENRKFLDEN